MTKIEKIQIVAEFELDEDLVLTAGSEAKRVQEKYGGKVQVLNVPQAAPPEAPRIIVRTENFLLNIGLVRYDIVINVPTHISLHPSKSLSFAYNIVEDIADFLDHLKNGYQWTGVITNVQFPSKETYIPSIKLAEPVFDKLVNISRKQRDLSTFQLQYGFQEGRFYRTFTISGYESLQFKIPPGVKPGSHIRLEKENADISESGLLIVVDVNNKPAPDKGGFVADFSTIMEEISSTVEQLPNTTNLRGVL